MSATSSPPDPFPDENQPPPGTEVNEVLPDTMGGFIAPTKDAIVIALRAALTDTSLSNADAALEVNAEYAKVVSKLPGIWVQFSITKLQRVGISHEVWPEPENPGDPWEPIQEWTFDGRVTLTVLSLTSLERDILSDALIMQLAFARPPQLVLTKNSDTKQFRTFITELAKNPYIALTVNTDVLTPMGQSINIGTPWEPDQIVYEDGYTFELMGEFQMQFKHDGTYSISRFDVEPDYNPGDWL